MSHRLPRCLVTAAAAVLPLLLAVGCTEDPIRPAPLDPSPTATATATPSDPTASTTPRAETAEEFIRRFWRVSDEMQNTGETRAFASMTWRCGSCRSFVRRISSIYDSGGSVRFDGSTVRSIERSGGRPTAPDYEVTVEVSQSILRETAGAAPERLAGGTDRYVVLLIRRRDVWLVNEYARYT